MNDGFIPKKYRAIDAAVTVAINTGNRSAGENLFTNSSRTNSVPAIGALNVAAIPAPAPEAISLSLSVPFILKNLPTNAPAPEPSCTLGPSLPRDRPVPIPAMPAKNFTKILLILVTFPILAIAIFT